MWAARKRAAASLGDRHNTCCGVNGEFDCLFCLWWWLLLLLLLFLLVRGYVNEKDEDDEEKSNEDEEDEDNDEDRNLCAWCFFLSEFLILPSFGCELCLCLRFLFDCWCDLLPFDLFMYGSDTPSFALLSILSSLLLLTSFYYLSIYCGVMEWNGWLWWLWWWRCDEVVCIACPFGMASLSSLTSFCALWMWYYSSRGNAYCSLFV